MATVLRANFDYLGEINKASLVMLVDTELVPRDLARMIAQGIEEAIDEPSRADKVS